MFLLYSCAPKMVVKNYNENNSHSATKFYESFADWALQPKWNKWVIEELNKLEAFSEKEIILE